MKICVISTPIFQLGDSGLVGYGGLEHLAWQQAKGLAEKGHQVALVAPDGSTCPGCEIIATGPAGQVREPDAYNRYWQRLLECNDGGCVIDHSWQKFSYILKKEGRLKAPVLGVCHAPVDTMFRSPPPVQKACVVCISHDQKNHYEGLFSGKRAKVAHNGCFEGGTLLDLENGMAERLDSFVRRKGCERVLSWEGQQFAYTEVLDWMELQPTNEYVVKIALAESELPLLSTPDNLIMTRGGWKAADEISCSDEVLYGEWQGVSVLVSSRDSICEGQLRKDIDSGNVGTVATSHVFDLQHSQKDRTAANLPKNQKLLDRRRRGHIAEGVSDGIGNRSLQTTIQSYLERDQGACGEVESSSPAGGLLLRCSGEVPIHLSKRIVRSIGECAADGCCLLGRDNRWRGACHAFVGSQKVLANSNFRDSKFGPSDNSIRAEMASCSDVVGSSKTKRSKGGNCKASGVAGNGIGIGGREGVGEDNPVHDSQEKKIGTSKGILSDLFGTELQDQIQRQTDSIVSASANGKFPTWKKVVSVERMPNPAKVFDLKTRTSNFVANGVVVHNCDAANFYRPLPVRRTNRYLFLARFSRIKGADLAIEACKKVGVGLDLIGDISITNEPDYLKQCQSMCDGKQIRMVGPATRGACVWWMSQAHAFLHPVRNFREPFGLAPIEANACGLPVIGWRNGALPETIKDGETGFLVESVEEMASIIKADKAASIDREVCRNNALRFSVEAMCVRYEALCQEAIATGGW